MKWETVIGLEVHAQLKTHSKLFSGSATGFGAEPNSQVSFIDAGFPGVLPVPNDAAIRMALVFGLAIDARINHFSYFERKNYFYPDLPKGYQISQFQKPIVGEGHINIETSPNTFKKINIVRAHLEEDAGKSIHDAMPHHSGIDLNRAGIPLLEIVTAPCLSSGGEAVAYLKELHRLLRFLDICDGNMQEGSFRCDVNISIRPAGSTHLGTRTEIKNLNSFKFIEKAVLFEEARHQDCLLYGKPIIQETRLYNPEKGNTEPMRTKEESQDYRYFPDPDLLPIEILPETLEQIRKTLPDLPQTIESRLKQENWTLEDIHFVLSAPSVWKFFSSVKSISKACDKLIVNWLKGPYASALNEKNMKFEDSLCSLDTLAKLLDKLQDKAISNNKAREIFKNILESAEFSMDEMIQAAANQSTDQTCIEDLIQNIIEKHPQQTLEYQQGKEKLLGFFMGLLMKETKGQFNPDELSVLLKKYLNE